MTFLESDLESIIINTDNLNLCDRGLRISGKKKRQVKIGNYGIADVITFDRFENHAEVTIYELKRDHIDVSALLQCVRYAKGVSLYLRSREFSFSIKLVLIGKTVDLNSDFVYFADIFENIKLYLYSYDFNGTHFERIRNYNLTNPGF